MAWLHGGVNCKLLLLWIKLKVSLSWVSAQIILKCEGFYLNATDWVIKMIDIYKNRLWQKSAIAKENEPTREHHQPDVVTKN